MNARPLVLPLLLAIAFGTSAPQAPAADESESVIAEKDINLDKIGEIFKTAFVKTEIDQDGDLAIEDDGIKTFIRVDEKKKLITFFSVWNLKASVPEIDKLKLANRLNNDLILVRFSVPNLTTLWCDYQLSYEDGIRPYSIVGSYRLFLRVTRGAVTSCDPDQIIGSD